MSMKVHYQVSLSNTSASGEGLLLDLSTEGCRMECKAPPPVNTYLSLRMTVSPTETPILVDLAAVRWSHANTCGIHFLSVRPPQAERLHRFLASQKPPERDDR
jgi:hypothetical protein